MIDRPTAKSAVVAQMRRGRSEWVFRGVVAAAAVTVGCLSVIQSFAVVLPRGQVSLAHRLAPHDAHIAALAARMRLLTNPQAQRSPTELAKVERLARYALDRDATAVEAIATLGVAADLRGKHEAARALFGYSSRLSRRDLQTQLWLIEDAVTRGDIPGALHGYDTALRTKKSASELLFPVLTTASTDPAVGAGLVRTLALKPLWTNDFLAYASEHSPDPVATARLFVAVARAGVPVAQAAGNTLIDSLLTAGKPDSAWNYYAATRPGVDRRRSRDSEFTALLDRPSHLDWIAADTESGISATIARSKDKGVFTFSIPPNAGGQLLTQLQLLPPGIYSLEGQSSQAGFSAAAPPVWTLVCSGDGRSLGAVALPVSAEGARFTRTFTVPADCPRQELRLITPGSESPGGTSGQIDRIELRPLR